MRTLQIIAIGIILAGLSPLALASDIAKEKRWADQIVDALLDGEAITLNDGNNDFLGILTESENSNGTGVIVLHGIGVHPDWPQVVHPLRAGLVKPGWTTLSLQLPVLPNEAEGKDYLPLIPEAAPRIKAGVEHLRGMGMKKIIIIAHSMGTRMAGYALAADSMGVNGYIAIGSPEGTQEYLSNIKLPVLDLYGSNDLAEVIQSAPSRKKAAAANRNFEQIVAKDADHFFNNQEAQLMQLVMAWLKRH